jgi:membrane-bound metal-dependent hydrolase YbcI (DUF457 family)
MPFTPFHFGPNSLVALPLRRYVDFPVFVLSSVAVDLEPLAVMLLEPDYPLHGYFHTFLIGSFVGIAWAVVSFMSRRIFKCLMDLIRLPYNTSFRIMLISGILGVWFHVLLDAPMHADIRPFYPLEANPLFGLLSSSTIYLICTIAFIPTLSLWGILVWREMK